MTSSWMLPGTIIVTILSVVIMIGPAIFWDRKHSPSLILMGAALFVMSMGGFIKLAFPNGVAGDIASAAFTLLGASLIYPAYKLDKKNMSDSEESKKPRDVGADRGTDKNAAL